MKMSRCWLQRFKSVAKTSSSVHVRAMTSGGGGEVARSRTRFESLVDRTTIYQLDTMASQVFAEHLAILQISL